jgi:hypothetical protein
MESIEQFLAKRLKLRGQQGHARGRQTERPLGFGFASGKSTGRPIAPQALGRFRVLTRRTGGRSLWQVAKKLSW